MTRPVGYGSPPNHTKWVKGQSGNPSGRRKGQANLATLLDRELSAMITITEGGRKKRISKREAVIKAVVNGSVKSDHRALASLIRMLNMLGEPQASQDTVLAEDDRTILANYLARNAADDGGER